MFHKFSLKQTYLLMRSHFESEVTTVKTTWFQVRFYDALQVLLADKLSFSGVAAAFYLLG